jgi:hypothetical protein
MFIMQATGDGIGAEYVFSTFIRQKILLKFSNGTDPKTLKTS